MSTFGPLSINFAYNRNDKTAYFVIESNEEDRVKAVVELNTADKTLQANILKNPDDFALPSTFTGFVIPIEANLAGSGNDLTSARILSNSTTRSAILLSETYEKIQIAAKKVFKKEISLKQNISENLNEATKLFKFEIKTKLSQHIEDFDSSHAPDEEEEEDSLEDSMPTSSLTASLTTSTTTATTPQPPVLPKSINYRFDREQQCICFLLETENPQQTKENFDKAGFDVRIPTKRDQTALKISDAYLMIKGVVIQLPSNAILKTELEKLQTAAQDNYGSKITLSPAFAATLEPKKAPPLPSLVTKNPSPLNLVIDPADVPTGARPFDPTPNPHPFGPPPSLNPFAGITSPSYLTTMPVSTGLTTSTTTTTTTTLTTTMPTVTASMTRSATTATTPTTTTTPTKLHDDDDHNPYYSTKATTSTFPIFSAPAPSSSSTTTTTPSTTFAGTTTAASSASSSNSTRAAQETQMRILRELNQEMQRFMGLTQIYPIESDEDPRLNLFLQLNKHYKAKAYELLCELSPKRVAKSQIEDTGMETFLNNPQTLLKRVDYNKRSDTILNHLIAMSEPVAQARSSSTSQPQKETKAPRVEETKKSSSKTSSYSKEEYEKLRLLNDALKQTNSKKTSSAKKQEDDNDVLSAIFGELSSAVMNRIVALICQFKGYKGSDREDRALMLFADNPKVLLSVVGVNNRTDTIMNHLLKEFGPRGSQKN